MDNSSNKNEPKVAQVNLPGQEWIGADWHDPAVNGNNHVKDF
jgi:hypothetical protein